MDNVKDVGFIFPVYNGEIYLGQRGTEPFNGYWGAIGGKQEKSSGEPVFEHSITKPNGLDYRSIGDELAIKAGREIIGDASVREFMEEAFTHLRYPEDVRNLISHVYKLGFVSDTPFEGGPRFDCFFHLATILRNDFNPSPREIHGIKPLREIDPEEIFPMSILALEHIRWGIENRLFEHSIGAEAYGSLNVTQIPEFEKMPTTMFTTMVGPLMKLIEKNRLDQLVL